MLWTISEWVLFLAILIGFLLVIEVTFRSGRHYGARSGRDEMPHVGALQGAVLGLLALLLGFTFAMAVQRFETRKSLVLEESNAIGTASLRAQFLPVAQQQEAAQLFKRCVAARVEFYNAGIDESRLDAAFATSAQIQRQLWAVQGGKCGRAQGSRVG